MGDREQTIRDEAKLKSVMELCGIKTRRDAIDYALAEAERHAKLRKMLSTRWDPTALSDSLDPNYDLLKMREREKGSHGRPG